jgi:hypothetical protein
MPYLFPNSESITLSNSSATVNFSGIDTTDVIKNENLAQLLTTESDNIEDWLKNLSDNWNTV